MSSNYLAAQGRIMREADRLPTNGMQRDRGRGLATVYARARPVWRLQLDKNYHIYTRWDRKRIRYQDVVESAWWRWQTGFKHCEL